MDISKSRRTRAAVFIALAFVIILTIGILFFPVTLHPPQRFLYAIIKGPHGHICIQSQAEKYYTESCFDRQSKGRVCYDIERYIYDFNDQISHSITEAQQQAFVLAPVLNGYRITVGTRATYFNPVDAVYLTKEFYRKKIDILLGSENDCFLFLGWIANSKENTTHAN